MLLAGLWCGNEKPPMNGFLKPVMDCINKLYSEGWSEYILITSLPCWGSTIMSICTIIIFRCASDDP